MTQFNDNGAWTWYSDERVVVDAAGGKIIISSDANAMGPGGSGRDGNVDAVIYDLNTRMGSRTVLGDLNPDEPSKVVEYGQTGRVRLTTLTREFFMPRFLERDEAEREPACAKYPWDGVRNVRPFSRFQKSVVEGVY